MLSLSSLAMKIKRPVRSMAKYGMRARGGGGENPRSPKWRPRSSIGYRVEYRLLLYAGSGRLIRRLPRAVAEAQPRSEKSQSARRHRRCRRLSCCVCKSTFLLWKAAVGDPRRMRGRRRRTSYTIACLQCGNLQGDQHGPTRSDGVYDHQKNNRRRKHGVGSLTFRS
jgi:hypothetical protein